MRDTDSLQEWAAAVCGVQQSEGLVLFSDDAGWRDVQVATAADAPAGTCVMYVPRSAFLTSYGSRSEFGGMEGAEELIGNLAGADQFPLFYLFLTFAHLYAFPFSPRPSLAPPVARRDSGADSRRTLPFPESACVLRKAPSSPASFAARRLRRASSA